VKSYFDHQKLDVYREAINFSGWGGKFDPAGKDQLTACR